MQAIGFLDWADGCQYSNAPYKDADYYDIGRPDQPVSGWVPVTYQMNFWRDIVPWEEEKSHVLLSGLGGGEWFDYPARHLVPPRQFDWCDDLIVNRWCNYFLYNHEWAGALRSRFGAAVLPYFSAAYADLARRVRPEWLTLVDYAGVKIDRVRHAMLCLLGDPETPYVGHDYRWNISDGRLEAMDTFYRRSLFNATYQADFDIDRLRRNPGGHNGRLWAFSTIYERVMR